MLRGGFFALVLAGCVSNLEVDGTVVVLCAGEADCPEGYFCGARGKCLERGAVEDLEPPAIISAEASGTFAVKLAFNEPVRRDSVIDPASYVILSEDGGAGVAVHGVRVDTEQSVTLFTEEQDFGRRYILNLSGASDLEGNVASVPLSAPFSGGGGLDPSPPDQTAPADGARFFGGAIVLEWSKRSGAGGYVVELSTDASFASFQSLPAPDPSLNVNLPPLPPDSYYWRVRADVTDDDAVLPVRGFFVMGDALYVSCPATIALCDVKAHVGNVDDPHQSLAVALSDALEHDISEVRVAGRGVNAGYTGGVILQPGVSLRGGYDPSFVQRDVATFETIIESDQDVIVSGSAITTPTIFEGFTVRHAATSFVKARTTAVALQACNGNLVLRDNRIVAGAAMAASTGVQIIGDAFSPGPVLSGNDIQAGDIDGDTGDSIGVLIQLGWPELVQNKKIAGGVAKQNSIGVAVVRAEPRIGGNTLITGANAPLASYGVYFSDAAGLIVADETLGAQVISTGNAAVQAVGVYRKNNEPWGGGIDGPAEGKLVIVGNSITTGSASKTAGVWNDFGDLSVEENLINVGQATGSGDTASVGVEIFGLASHGIFSSLVSAGSVVNAAVGAAQSATSRAVFVHATSVASSEGNVKLAGNILLGGAVGASGVTGALSASYGAVLDDTANALFVFNNVIVSGTVEVSDSLQDAESVALWIAAQNNPENQSFTHDVQVYNNHLIARSVVGGLTSRAVGLYLAQATQEAFAPEIVNNIILTLGVAQTRYAALEACTECSPSRLSNNLFVNVAASGSDHLYGDVSAGDLDDDGDGDFDEELTTAGTAATRGGNIAFAAPVTDASTIFVDPEGLNADPLDDFEPTGANLCLDAGRNLFHPSRLATDLLGQARPICTSQNTPCDEATPAWDIGAFESAP